MSRATVLPATLHGRPYAAAVFTGCTLVGLVAAAYGAAFAFATGSQHLPNWVAAFDIAIAAICLIFAWAVTQRRVRSIRGLEHIASIVLTLAYWTVLAEMVGSPARTQLLTAHCYLVVVGAGVVIRSRRTLLALILAAVTTWTVTVELVQAPHFVPQQWWSTWLIAGVISFAANLVATTEWSVEQQVLRVAQTASWRDALTGLANRRGLTTQATQLVALSRRRNERLWCAFVDVDHFKSVNDLLAHEAGDEVLVGVASALRVVARGADLAARWGGDEFVLLGLGAPPDERDLERRINAHLSRLDAKILRRWAPAVTVGVANSLAEGPDPLAELIAAADQRMYERRRAVRSA